MVQKIHRHLCRKLENKTYWSWLQELGRVAEKLKGGKLQVLKPENWSSFYTQHRGPVLTHMGAGLLIFLLCFQGAALHLVWTFHFYWPGLIFPAIFPQVPLGLLRNINSFVLSAVKIINICAITSRHAGDHICSNVQNMGHPFVMRLLLNPSELTQLSYNLCTLPAALTRHRI